jgi:hypothetical protein
MASTLEGLAVAVLALLPGALFMWSFEREAGIWGINLPDRILRFLGISALLHVLAAPATYWLWKKYVDGEAWKEDTTLPWALYGALLAYVAVPILAGVFLGWRTHEGGRVTAILTGDRRPPRAWDHLFSQQPDGWVRLKLRTGIWVGGAYAKGSWAAGYPEPQDLFLLGVAELDPDTGEFKTDDCGNPVVREDAGLLVRWNETDLEFINA